MRRTQIYLDEGQDRALAARASDAGRTKSAVIRDAIDAYLAPDDEHAALERLRTAVADAVGAAPDLPPGPAYVERLRTADRERQRRLER